MTEQERHQACFDVGIGGGCGETCPVAIAGECDLQLGIHDDDDVVVCENFGSSICNSTCGKIKNRTCPHQEQIERCMNGYL